MAKAPIEINIPQVPRPSAQTQARIKALLLHALEDMVTNNGHMIEESADYALASLIVRGQYETAVQENCDKEGQEEWAKTNREYAKDAEIL